MVSKERPPCWTRELRESGEKKNERAFFLPIFSLIRASNMAAVLSRSRFSYPPHPPPLPLKKTAATQAKLKLVVGIVVVYWTRTLAVRNPAWIFLFPI